MKKRKRIDKNFKCMVSIVFIYAILGLLHTGCTDGVSLSPAEYPNEAVYDPSLPVVVSDFNPKSGKLPTQMIITGSNFGSDTSMIKVKIDQVPLHVISSDGNHIYALLSDALPEIEDGFDVTVTIGKDGNEKEVVAEQKFLYQVEAYVITVAGWVSEEGRTQTSDGPIGTGSDYAQFSNENLCWLTFDQEKNLYVLEEGNAIRFIPNTWDRVETKVLKQNLNRFRTISFRSDYKSMFVTNDQDGASWTNPGSVELTDADDFTSFRTIINSRQTNGGAFHPKDDVYFYNSYTQGVMYKWLNDGNTDLDGRNNSEELFRIRDVEYEFNVQFHPSGDFAYIVVINKHYILKSYYNKEKQILEDPVMFVGANGQSAYEDGVGTFARFRNPYQGVFIGDDFYICDQDNHCIRKITKDGVVSTFAGRPEDPGYDDGAVRDARFRRPTGIAYDEVEMCFYVADRNNARIRKIVLPKNETNE